MILTKDKNNHDDKLYITLEKASNIEICINDIQKIKYYMQRIHNSTEYNIPKQAKTSNYVRIYNTRDKRYYKMYVAKITIGELELYDVDKEFYISVIINSNEYLNIYLRHFVDEIDKQDNLKYEPIICDKFYSTNNHFIIDMEEEINALEKTITEKEQFLLNWKSYYEFELSEIENEAEDQIAEVDLVELRNNFEFWDNISDIFVKYIPVKVHNPSQRSTRSASLSISDVNNLKKIDLLKSNRASFKALSKISSENILETAKNDFDYRIKSDIGVIESDEELKFSLSSFKDMNIAKAEIKKNLVGEKIRLKRIIEGIQKIIEKDSTNESLISQIINNELTNNNDYKPNKERIKSLEDEYLLNHTQALVVDKILNMNDLFLVQGPPGTGKTTIISTIVKELNKQNKQVLLTSNVAAARKNITERIKGEKELIIKEYTVLKKDDKTYSEELKENKLNYIKNQVIEKYCFNNKFIYTKEEFDNLKETKELYLETKKSIERLYEEVERYKANIVEEQKKLENITKIKKDLEKNSEYLYKLIIKDDIEKIDKKYLDIYLTDFLEEYNRSNLPIILEKILYQKNLIKKYNKTSSLIQKLKFFNNINKIMLQEITDIKNMPFYDKYIEVNNIRRLLFNLSKLFPVFCINNQNINDIKKELQDNENALKKVNYSLVQNEFNNLIEIFKKRLDIYHKNIQTEIENYENLIIDSEFKIDEANKKNYNINEKIKALDTFIEDFEKNKKIWNNDGIFYDYLQELSLINTKNIDQEYLNSMLSGEKFNSIFEYNYDSGNILSMSTNQVAKLLDNSSVIFDYIFVDEASKCNFNDLIISLSRTKKLVLIGDYLQLDPVKSTKNADYISDGEWDKIQLSNFSQLLKKVVAKNFNKKQINYDNSESIGILKQQYRMSKEIFELISSIYESVDQFTIENSKKDNPNEDSNILSIQCDGIESQKTDEETSRSNESEITVIIEIMEYIKDLAEKHEIENIRSIGIISFYKLQSKYLNSKLTKLNKELRNQYGINIQIGTVDNFQGREFDLVIVSCVRTIVVEPFLTEIRRWNVSISRAKNKLILVGNFEKLKEFADKQNIDPNKNQESKELDVIYKKIIPKIYSLKEEFTEIKDTVQDFLRKGNE